MKMAKTMIFEFEIRGDLTRSVKAEVSKSALAFGWMLDDSDEIVASYQLQFPYGTWTAQGTMLQRCEDVARVILDSFKSSDLTSEDLIKINCDESTDRAPYRISSRRDVS